MRQLSLSDITSDFHLMEKLDKLFEEAVGKCRVNRVDVQQPVQLPFSQVKVSVHHGGVHTRCHVSTLNPTYNALIGSVLSPHE